MIYKDIFMMDLKRRILLIICLIVIVAIVIVWNKPSISQYEDSFGFSLGDTEVKVIDYYHHSDFRDSISIYRIDVIDNSEINIFDENTMIIGLSSEAETLLDMALETSSNSSRFEDLDSINRDDCRLTVLKEKNGDAELCIINYSVNNQYLVIWVG